MQQIIKVDQWNVLSVSMNLIEIVYVAFFQWQCLYYRKVPTHLTTAGQGHSEVLRVLLYSVLLTVVISL